MSDILNDLLIAYNDDITNKRAVGQPLDFIKSHFVVIQPQNIPPDFSTTLPCLLIYPLNVPANLICLGAYLYEKNYEIGMTLIQENSGLDYGIIGENPTIGIIENLDNLSRQYYKESFSISSKCELIEINFESLDILPFLNRSNVQGTITLRHHHEDDML